MKQVDAYLTTLAQEIAHAWWRAHGGPQGPVDVLINPDSLAVLVENAFTKAELAVADDARGRILLRQYAERLFDQASPDMIAQVEAAMGHEVVSAAINVDLDAGWIMCFFRLGAALGAGHGSVV